MTTIARPALVVGSMVLAMAAVVPAEAAPPVLPPLRLAAAAQAVTLGHMPDYGVYLDLGVHVVAGAKPLEVRATRGSYAEPIVAHQLVDGRARKLPAGLLDDFTGLPGFLRTTITDPAGTVVAELDQTWCPNGEGARTRPDAPDTSPYPVSCSTNPFTLGGVWGVQKGWATATFDPMSGPVDVPVGSFTATVSVAGRYQDMFGIPADQASVSVQLTVLSGGGRGTAAPPRPAATRPAATPSAEPIVVPRGPKPDLRPLPAWQIDVAPQDGRDYLRFAANVWNAGPSPLVLDGFRRPGEDVMDAYQYFYDDNGQQVGYARTGTMEWDAREGHHHWHFTDFASYRLLDATQSEVVHSQKEAFCLAATDAIDYTVKNANWRPTNTDLHTACGDANSLAVREVLDVGSGDTYVQFLPGQSFDVTDLPNGTYHVQVIANPERNLHEADLGNNVSLRQVVLGGTPGARTVTVPPYQLVDAP